jgi:hypothetical protein
MLQAELKRFARGVFGFKGGPKKSNWMATSTGKR